MTYLEFFQKANANEMAYFLSKMQLQLLANVSEKFGLEFDTTKCEEILVADCEKFLLEEIQ